jgi:AraC family transcriptional regulator
MFNGTAFSANRRKNNVAVMTDTVHKTRIDRVVDYIQANLGSELTVKGLSAIACFSEFHFSRIFKAQMGESVYQFIRRLRLEKAAEMLALRPGLAVTEVALTCGFTTPSAFAKSFKDHFKVSATQWRRQCRMTVREEQARSASGICRLAFAGGAPVWTSDCEEGCRRITLEQMPRLKVGYIRYVGPYQENDTLFDNLYHRLFQWALPKGFLNEAPVRFNIFHDNPDITQSTRLRVMAAIPVPESIGKSNTVGIFTLSGGTYGVCRLQLKKGEFVKAWEWMFATWLARSGYELDDREMLERYLGERTVNGQQVFDVDLCIPVRAK